MPNYKTFCNDKDMPTNSGFVSCDNDGVITADLIDHVTKVDAHVCNKMGTSIPTLFARMFLFSSAYNDIESLEGRPAYQGKAHNYVINPDTNERYQNVYHHLISEHLDMLEFLFTHGTDIQVRKWNFHTFEDRISQSGDEKLEKLSAAIGSVFQDTPTLQNHQSMDVLLFMYKNVLIGGTSPNLIVFTSPNWKRELRAKGWDFGTLFTDVARPLHERSQSFRQLLTLMAMGGLLNSEHLQNFKKYIISNKENGYDPTIKNWYNGIVANYGTQPVSEWVDAEIKKVAEPMQWDDNNAPQIVVNPVEFVKIYQQTVNQQFDTEYKIAPTRLPAHWETENINGAPQTLKGAPMLIVPNGIPGAKYYDGDFWDNTTAIPQHAQLCNEYLSLREVPGKGKVKYPILTADDFLENDIIELAYNIDREHFFTACDEMSNFMLPIKKMYFRFFTFEDLKKHLKITLCRDKDNVIERVNVVLTIPMESKKVKSHTITRTYSYDENAIYRIVSCRRQSDAFNLGIFPFFKSENKPQLNSYRFMLGETSTKVKCYLGKFDESGFVVPRDGDEADLLEFKLRSKRDALSTSFAEYNESFDYLEFKATVDNLEVAGMFFPLMDVVGIGMDNKWNYSVDFGTSNTHIVMAELDNHGAITTPKSFEYTDQTPLMVTLGLSKSNKFGVFDDDALREFVPKSFKNEQNEDLVKFPIRSVLYEKNKAGNNPCLFDERNVGFNYKREVSTRSFSSNKYVSDLKWNIHAAATFKCRVEAYCYQILWMLRNHSLTHGGTEKIQVAVTYPLAMRPTQLRTIKDAWKNAWKNLIDDNNPFPERNFMIESLAPYKYSAVTNTNLLRTDAYVNMDIGGGSTDILFYKEGVLGKPTKSRAYSVFFAANDLWGTGMSPTRRNVKDNGFIINLEKELEAIKKTNVDNYKDIASNASDVVTYLFSKPQEYHFADSIRQSKIASVVVVHFAATIYYLANIIKTNNLEIPSCVNFSGMGSKYIDIIVGSNEELASIVKVIFKHVGLNVANLNVSRDSNPKEVTALGAIYMLDPETTKVETPRSTIVYCIDGEEDMEDALTYEDTTKDSTWNMVKKEMDKFTTLLQSQSFISTINNAGIMYSFNELQSNGFDINNFESSYVTMTDSFAQMSDDEKKANLKDAPFFWALKDTLYNVALAMAKTK